MLLGLLGNEELIYYTHPQRGLEKALNKLHLVENDQKKNINSVKKCLLFFIKILKFFSFR